MSDNTYIMDLTVAEFQDLIRRTIAETPRRRIVRGIQGIADALQVSTAQAKRIKASGLLDSAITQSGRIILTDADAAVRIYTKKTNTRTSNINSL